MTELEFKELHRLDDEDLDRIKTVCKLWNGQIVSIKDIKK